ncbi:MAG: DNA recombination protein RmuC [Solirubrobacteraceae bacterium]|jgi:DNA recombination protein RmuC
MDAIWLFIGLLAGAAAALLALRPRLRAGAVAAARAGEVERARAELDRELVRTQSELEHERARAQAELAHERARGEERLAAVNDAQERLSSSFKALSAEALQASLSQLTQMARSQLQVAQTEVKGDLDKRQQAVEQLVAPLKDQLSRVDAQLLALDRERRESRGRLDAQLRSLSETGERLRSETGALVTALRKPNARGQWGQMQLRNVVEMAGMLRHCDFAEQSSLGSEEQSLRPDVIVKLPGDKHVVIDAKAPLQGVLDAYQARDEEERQRHLRDHGRLLRKHVKLLADKAYWAELESAPDFVVMFLPGEHLYGAALEADPALIEDAMARRVLIATPTTLLAMLRAVGYGWQQERVAESARAISELGRELHARLVKLSGLLATLGTRLNSAVRAYNDTVGSYEARVLPGARRFADHGVGGGRELPELEQVTVSARSVHVAQLQLQEDDDTPPRRRLRAADQG